MTSQEGFGRTVAGSSATERSERLRRAMLLHQSGDLTRAESAYRQLLAEAPRDAVALHLLGVIEGQKGNLDGALELIVRSLAIDPRQPLAHSNRAKILLGLQQPHEALQSARHALRLEPRLTEALHHEGGALQRLGRSREALQSFQRALALQPADARALTRCGELQLTLREPQAALGCFEAALRLRAQDTEALRGRARACYELNRCEEGLEGIELALRLDPVDAAAHTERGLILHGLGLAAEASASYDRALELRPGDAVTYANQAAALSAAGRPDEAALSWERALTLAPEHPYGPGDLLYARLQCCDWRDHDAAVRALVAGVRARRRVSSPFAFLSASESPQTELTCAQTYFADRYRRPDRLPEARRGGARRRIAVAYLSSDFRNHAMTHLITGLIEGHDRTAFAVTALSSGPDDRSPQRERLRRAFEHFIDIRRHSDRAAADLIRGLGIDILVDLNGFTAGNRCGVVALRPAPIQVSYVGYTGTSGGDAIDYLIADAHVIPAEEQRFYTEMIARLPNCYLPCDRRRAIAACAPTRGEAGLPESGFVFCCFNATYKIVPAIFDLWMRLLCKVDGSVLWLFSSNAAAETNLRREALQRGVAAERLVFAERRDPAEHLARHALADLFLDTLPINAHTTASDALWAGLPVLTCSGGNFAGRVAGSLLKAVGLGDMITGSLREYEERALWLATRPAELAQIRARLAHNRTTHPLFDTDGYRRDLEVAYRLMWERWQRREPPACLAVPAPVA